jgi:hypothetical protein
MSNSRNTVKKRHNRSQMMVSLNLKYIWLKSHVLWMMDILQYWKLKSVRFPQLATMACDILSISITTMTYESSFGIGCRILNNYRNCSLTLCKLSFVHVIGCTILRKPDLLVSLLCYVF